MDQGSSGERRCVASEEVTAVRDDLRRVIAVLVNNERGGALQRAGHRR